MPPKKATNKTPLPSKKDILAFISSHDSNTPRRDIARAFGVKGADRAQLRSLLKQMEEDGLLQRSGRSRFMKPDALPPVCPIDVMSVNDDGDLICMPVGWRSDGPPPAIRIAASRAAKHKPAPGVGDRLLVRLKPAGDTGYDADIIKAIGKGAHRFLAVFRKTGNGAIAEPVERRARHSFTIDRGDTGKAQDGDLVWVETKNARGHGPKKGRVTTIAGHVDERGAFSLIALANHNIPVEFSAEILSEVKKAKTPPLGKRTDLRDLPLLTIDPADAKDHDDALWAAPDDDPENEGGFKVIVAIADVSHFVRPGSALDREAQKRGNSTYLPDRVTPMLPERLSNDLCSLRESEDRPCLAVEMIISAKGVKKSHRFMRAMMRSAAKLSYEQAQEIIEGKKQNAIAGEPVRCLHAAYKARLVERKKRAPLDLDAPERKIILDKNGDVKKVIKRDRFDAHRLVEEFMILANVAAAETLERKRLTFIYRVHDQPDPEKLNGVRDYLASLDYSLIKGGAVRPSHFNQLLKLAGERDQKEMVSEVVLRSQQQAVYAVDNLGHFGLNLARYAHFTSPIRRYADLTVHRALVTAGKFGGGGQSDDEAASLRDIAQSISDLERRSIAAEREASDRYLADYLANRIGASFDGRIRGVTRFGLFVMLEESGADGFIPMRTLGAEYFRFDEDNHAVIGETTNGVYYLGQQVSVRLAEATPLTGGLRFDMLSAPAPGKKLTRKAGDRKKPRKGASKKKDSKRGGKRKSKNKKPRRQKRV